MIDWADVLKMTMSMFAIIDPVGAVGIFLGLTHGQTPTERQRTALITALTMIVVLVTAALVGEKILWYFSIGIPSFQVGGGIIILLMAIAMLNARMPGMRRTREEELEAEDKDTIAVVPLAIPMLAGPGAISKVIIDAHTAQNMLQLAVIVGVILMISLFTWSAFRMAVPISTLLGRTGLNIVTRLMGLLLSAISVEIIADGLKGLFPAMAGM